MTRILVFRRPINFHRAKNKKGKREIEISMPQQKLVGVQQCVLDVVESRAAIGDFRDVGANQVSFRSGGMTAERL